MSDCHYHWWWWWWWWWWYHSRAAADKGPVSVVSAQLRSAQLHWNLLSTCCSSMRESHQLQLRGRSLASCSPAQSTFTLLAARLGSNLKSIQSDYFRCSQRHTMSGVQVRAARLTAAYWLPAPPCTAARAAAGRRAAGRAAHLYCAALHGGNRDSTTPPVLCTVQYRGNKDSRDRTLNIARDGNSSWPPLLWTYTTSTRIAHSTPKIQHIIDIGHCS